ncbi:MAG: murein biosynthesis integral membrane protein MurJ [Actinobacteria bacterium]|nr:murein biosynthesis integral membrane protein MurJ [Actinomycetota bacterium]
MSGLLRSNVAVAAGTAISRTTGLVRVAVFGAVLGKSSLTDAYNQANATPNLIYELVIGGVLSATLVPLFTKLRHADDEAGEVAVRSVSLVVMAAVTAIAVGIAPWLFGLYAAATAEGVDLGLYHEVGGTLAAFFLVQIFFYGINALATAELHARKRYFAAAWAPALSNLVVILSLLLVPSALGGATAELGDVLINDRLRWTLGLGATVGIAVMAVTVVPALLASGAPRGFRPAFANPAVQQLRKLSGWALGYVAANQMAIIVVQNLLVRSGEGNQTAYTNAFTFLMLPHGLLAMSIVTTFLPEMSQAVAEHRRDRLIDRTDLGLRLVAMLTIPAGFGLFALRRPIIGLALQHGEYSSADALVASRALAGFALGLGAFSVYLFALRAFYAHSDARTAYMINLGENVLNIVLAFVLYERFGVLGIAAAFAIAYAISALWTLQILSYKVPGFPLRPLLAALYRMTLAAAIMAEAAWAVARVVGGNAGLAALLRVVVSGVVGIAVYLGVLLILRAPELQELKSRLRGAPSTKHLPDETT